MKSIKKILAVSAVTFLIAGCSTAPYVVKQKNHKLIFYAQIPQAKEVYFVSNLTNFKKVRAKRIGNGEWKVVVPYKTGLVKYFYLVNGHVFLPPCKVKENDGFGGKDCVYLGKSM